MVSPANLRTVQHVAFPERSIESEKRDVKLTDMITLDVLPRKIKFGPWAKTVMIDQMIVNWTKSTGYRFRSIQRRNHICQSRKVDLLTTCL